MSKFKIGDTIFHVSPSRLPDVHVICPLCQGTELLEVRPSGHDSADAATGDPNFSPVQVMCPFCSQDYDVPTGHVRDRWTRVVEIVESKVDEIVETTASDGRITVIYRTQQRTMFDESSAFATREEAESHKNDKLLTQLARIVNQEGWDTDTCLHKAVESASEDLSLSLRQCTPFLQALEEAQQHLAAMRLKLLKRFQPYRV